MIYLNNHWKVESNIPDITEAFDGVGHKLDVIRREVEGDLNELLLPVNGRLVCRLQLQPTALTPVQLHVVRNSREIRIFFIEKMNLLFTSMNYKIL